MDFSLAEMGAVALTAVLQKECQAAPSSTQETVGEGGGSLF